MRILLGLLIMFSCALSKSQENKTILDIIKDISTIEYGQLPFYWAGYGQSIEHGFFYNDSLKVADYNNIIRLSLAKNSENCYVINTNNEKVVCQGNDVFFDNSSGCWPDASYMVKDSESIHKTFCPLLFVSSKSIVDNKFYVVYFWRATSTENLTYYSLVFSKEGQLLSYQLLFDGLVTHLYYPFLSKDNKIRTTDVNHGNTHFVSKKIFLVEYPYNIDDGASYVLSTLDTCGHYRNLKVWSVEGQVDSELQRSRNDKNEIFVDDNGKETYSFNTFKVVDKDGYCNVREKDDVNSSVIRTLKNNDLVFGTYSNTGWCKVAFSANDNGETKDGGYIHLSRLIDITYESTTRNVWAKQIGVK